MRARLFAAVVLFGAMAAAPGAQRAAPSDPALLPVRRVMLFKTGVGYFEHLGSITGSGEVAIEFTSAQLDDVLTSLTALDLDRGQIASITYNSVAPVAQRLAALHLPLGADPDTRDLYRALRGAHVDVRAGTSSIQGRLLNIEKTSDIVKGDAVEVNVLTIVGDDGTLRSVRLGPDVSVHLRDADVRDDLGRYLGVIASARAEDARRMVLTANGTGARRLFVSYISEVPVWKSTYRLVLPDKGTDKPLLQGWAIVDNTVSEDWKDVELSLVAGAPHSFIEALSQPYYARRPIVPLPQTAQLAPQTHAPTLQTEEVVAESPTVAPSRAPVRVAGNVARRGDVAGGVVGGMVGGLPEPPPPPATVFQQMATMTAASARDLGDLFEYRVAQPITILKNQSALVPIVNARIDAERVSLWNRGAGNGRPLRALWLTNTTRLTLDGGTLSVIDGSAFAGEGLVDPVKPGERRLVSYATDLGVVVEGHRDDASGRFTRITAHDGILIATEEQHEHWIYRVRNEDTTARTIVIEHALKPGWTVAPDPKPADTTPTSARFRVPVEAKKDAMLAVTTSHAGDTRYELQNLDQSLVMMFEQTGFPSDELAAALKPLTDARELLAAAEDRLGVLAGQVTTITRDQDRLRENMKALRGSDAEKQLLLRYTRELNDQEDQLATLKREIADTTAERDRRREALSRIVKGLTFDVQDR